MDLGLTGARALVGGGSGGLGGAIAAVLREEGAQVGLLARPSERLDAVAARLDAVAVPADLATPDGPELAVSAAAEALGGLDLLVVNSGGPPPGRFEELDEDAWRTAIDGTLLSAVRLLRSALPILREGRDPAILIVLSSSVREPIPSLTTSNLIRPGLAGLVKSLVDEIVPIRINGLAPGRLATDRIGRIDEARSAATGLTLDEITRQAIARIPLGRYGDPRELGRVAAFLLSPAASYVTGAIVPVDGGMIRALP
jgi:3-oxoacyl-[acyl-carrier protein] reductase